MLCAYCGKTIPEGENVYVCLDNWLQWNHYTDLPGEFNRYCSKECFADDWTVEEIEYEEALEYSKHD